MKTIFALVFLIACFSAQASTLSEIDRSNFGKNLLDTVYLELTTGDNAQTVLELLQEVEDQIIQEQQDHDTRHSDFQGSCEHDKASYNNEITLASNDRDAAQGKLDVARPEESRLANELSENEAGLAATEETLAAAIATIEQQRVDFKTHEAELLAALEIFISAEGALRTAFNRGSFLQTASGAEFAATLKKANLNDRLAPFARILAQAASSSYLTQDAVESILNIIKRLTDNTRDTLNFERQTMQAREDEFAFYSEQLNASITHYKNTIARLSTELQMVRDNIAQWERDLSDAIYRFDTYTQRLADRTAECDEENREYHTASTQRTEELVIINQVEDLISSRVADFTQYITSTRGDVHID